MKLRTTGLIPTRKVAKFTALFGGLFFCAPVIADCIIEYAQPTTISENCDGFLLSADQLYSINIDPAATVSSGSTTITFNGFNMSGVLTNNGSITTTRYGAIFIDNSSVYSIVNNGLMEAAVGETLHVTNGSTLDSFTNAGTITSLFGITIYNVSNITLISNSGSITSSGPNAILNLPSSHITTLINTNDISSNNETISNYGFFGTITNSGNISASTSVAINNDDEIEMLNNLEDGTIDSASDTIYNAETGSITTINNAGLISASADSAINNLGGITNLTNSATGTISSPVGTAITNALASTITNLTNSGTVIGSDGISNLGTINTLTNTGTITALEGVADILNNGTLTTLSNRQGGSDPLSLTGNLPTNYQIIIASPTNYGKIVFTGVDGVTNFDIHATSSVNENTTYTDVITGISDAELGATTGTFTDTEGDSYDWSLSLDGASYDLVLGACEGSCGEEEVASYPSAVATQSTVNSIASSINAQFSSFAMTTNFANLNTYDCGLFDQNNGCFSLGGRYTDVNGNNNSDSDSTALVMVGGYKVDDTFRIAGFVDQMVNNSTPTGIKIDNQNPMLGVSLVWNQHANHLGYQFKLANAYQSKDVTITRTSTGDAEAGAGSTDVTVNSIIAEASYQFLSQNRTSYRPYFAGRYAKIKQDGYTETNVDNGLTYQDLEDESITLIMGVKAKHLMTEQLILNGSIGVEQDIYNDSDDLIATATNIAGITPVDINSDENKTRPVVSLGADYFISPTQRLSLQAQYQELAFTSTSAKTAYVNYTIGF